MLLSKFFLNIKILFIFNLLILSCFTLSFDESEDVFITYTSNYNGIYQVIMDLKNKENSFSIVYDMLDNQFISSIAIKDWNSNRIGIKTIKLSVCDKSFKIKPSIMDALSDVSFKNSKVSKYCSDCILCSQYEYNNLKFPPCSKEWKRLIEQANGNNLCFNVTCIDMDSKVEREYLFRVSASNLQKFIDCVMFSLKVIKEFSSKKSIN